MKITDYIGIPFLSHGRTFTGSDCWGVVRLYYYCEKGIDLPSLSAYNDTNDSDTISQIIAGEKPRWIPVETPQEGDVVVIAIAGKETHVGIYLKGNKMLHAFRGTDSCIESLKAPQWKNRIRGLYRYE